MSIIFVTAGLLVLIFIVIITIKNSNNSNVDSQYKSKALMSDNEFEFFQRLVQALPQYYIFPQVSFGAFLQANASDFKEKSRIRLTFCQKIADYVIYDKDKKIIAIIELDDKMHDIEKDKKRDAMVAKAGYKTIRFQSKRKPSINEIANIINQI